MNNEKSSQTVGLDEIFSFHLVHTSFLNGLRYFFRPLHNRNINGLKHSEAFFVMNLGEGVLSTKRFNTDSLGFFMWWNSEAELDDFLKQPKHQLFTKKGWHIRLRLYRRWGGISEINNSTVVPERKDPNSPVVAVTLARLRLTETLRFTKWGKPVERQVRDHSGNTLALAAFRPWNTFCTFSIWKNEDEMTSMVFGKRESTDGHEHKIAMVERSRKPFHFEFTTMRFIPFQQSGQWRGDSDYIR